LEQNSDSAPHLIYPPNTRYQCVKCGECCRQQWVIDVEQGCPDKLPGDIKSHIHPVDNQRQSGGVAGVIRPDPSRGGCPLLGADNLCVIHKRLGYNAKPLVCKKFPFRFIETPRGIVVDVSFVCNEVLHNRGEPIEQYQHELEELAAQTSWKITVADRILLKTKISVTYDAYLLIEEKLLSILSARQATLEDRLVAGNIFLFSLCKNIYDDERITLNEASIEKRLARFAPRHMTKLYLIAKKGKKMCSRHRQQLFVITFLTFASSALERKSRLRVLLDTWINNTKQTLNVGKIRVPVLAEPVALRKLSDVAFDAEDTSIGDLAARYLSHCIFRKVLIAQYGIFRGYNMLLLMYGVMKWLSKVFALQDGKDCVEPTHFANAIKLVERQYLRHSEHLALLKVESRAMRFVDKVFEDLGFAPLIVKS